MLLVTGGTGLLGAQLIYDLVKSGEQVVALKRTSSDLSVIEGIFDYYSDSTNNDFDKIIWKEGDVLDIFSILDALDGVDGVYHCAAMVSFNPKLKDQMMKVNIEGTANVVNACLEKGIKKLCFASSVAALGRAPKGVPTNEEVQWKNSPDKSNYSISKYASEQEVWRGAEEGLDVVIVNPTIILGPGNWKKSSARMFLNIWRGLSYYTTGVNGFIDIRDVSKIMIQLMKSEIKNERFILNSEALPFKLVFGAIAEALGKKKPTIAVSPWMGEVFWRFDKIRSMLTRSRRTITRELARSSSAQHYYDNGKVVKSLGYTFIPVNEAVEHTAKIFLAQQAN